MMADAFSMFDYGGAMGLVLVFSWGGSWVALSFVMFGSDQWVMKSRLVSGVYMLSDLFANQVLGSSRMVYGFALFCVGLFVYLSFLGMYSIFPYMFCLTAHFSHNFSISMVLWFTTLILNLIISVKGFTSHFVPSGLSWYQAAPVGVFEMISNLSRFVTLGARLTMNMIAGKLLLCVGSAFFGAMVLNGMIFSVSGLCFLFLLMALTGWEMIVGIIQAYIFTFLSVTYIDEAPTYKG
nr:ATP synthase F0 subunit 6 [Macoma balthica]AJC10808.1 ATP synthase F0 subunit 6 [Macoma balthica]AJC10821.1 ATP synthase F0 subunit 6 [Macoma balthica]AJC10834.1 ATP synthase F0 subunit 6 [Macoma balthica]